MPFVDTNNLLATKVKPYNFDINTIPKAMRDTVFFGTNFGGGQIFIHIGRILQRGRVLSY